MMDPYNRGYTVAFLSSSAFAGILLVVCTVCLISRYRPKWIDGWKNGCCGCGKNRVWLCQGGRAWQDPGPHHKRDYHWDRDLRMNTVHSRLISWHSQAEDMSIDVHVYRMSTSLWFGIEDFETKHKIYFYKLPLRFGRRKGMREGDMKCLNVGGKIMTKIQRSFIEIQIVSEM